MTLEVLASGAVGFLGAYILARIVHHWDEQKVEREERLAKIQAARIICYLLPSRRLRRNASKAD